MENWLVLELGQNIYKMSLEHLIMSESKEVLTYTPTPTAPHNDQVQEPKRAPSGQNWNNQSNTISKEVWIIIQNTR